jgi:hypothetical protein
MTRRIETISASSSVQETTSQILLCIMKYDA